MKTYSLSGVVYGKLWGGGFGAYPASKIKGKDYYSVVREAQKLLKSGGLDSGMGFESLKGALLDIQEVEVIAVNGKSFQRNEFFTKFIGDLTEKEQNFLLNCEF